MELGYLLEFEYPFVTLSYNGEIITFYVEDHNEVNFSFLNQFAIFASNNIVPIYFTEKDQHIIIFAKYLDILNSECSSIPYIFDYSSCDHFINISEWSKNEFLSLGNFKNIGDKRYKIFSLKKRSIEHIYESPKKQKVDEIDLPFDYGDNVQSIEEELWDLLMDDQPF